MSRIFVVLLMSLAFIACDNATEEAPVPPKTSTLNKLIGKWTVESIVEKGQETAAACNQDDLWEFKESGKIDVQFNKSCSGTDGETDTFGYEISEDGRFITFDYTQTKREILELTQTKLKYTYDFQGGAVVFTYRKSN